MVRKLNSGSSLRPSEKYEPTPAATVASIMKTTIDRSRSAQAERLKAIYGAAWSRRTFWPGRRVCTPAVTTISSGARPCAITTSATPWLSTSTPRSETVLVDGSKSQTAAPPWDEVSAEAGIRIPASPPRWMLPVTVDPRRIASGGSASPTLTWKVRVTGSAWGESSRTRPVARTPGSEVNDTVTSGSTGVAASITRAGTPKTASRPSSRATRTIIWPAATTSPGSAPTAVTEPVESAKSSVKPSSSRAVASCARAASTWAAAASRALVARSKAARGATWREKSDCWRSNSRRASAARASAAARFARAARTAFSKVVDSSRATRWPGTTRSPTRTLRSTMRWPTRKARFTSSSASIRPVSETVSPPGSSSTAIVRTGRISGAGGSSGAPQAASARTVAVSATSVGFCSDCAAISVPCSRAEGSILHAPGLGKPENGRVCSGAGGSEAEGRSPRQGSGRSGALPLARRRVLAQDAPQLLDASLVPVHRVARGLDHQLRIHALEVRARVAHETVASLPVGAVAAHRDDRVRADARRDGEPGQRLQEAVARGHVVEAGGLAVERGEVELVASMGHEVEEGLADLGGQLHEARDPARDAQIGHVRPPVGRRHEDDALHEGQRLEEERALEQGAGLRLELDLREGAARDDPPEGVAALHGHQLGEQAALRMSDHHHPSQRGIAAVGIEARHDAAQSLGEDPGGPGDRVARVVEEEPDLVVARDLGVALQLVHELRPGRRAREGPVHEDQRDPAAGVRPQEHQRLGMRGPQDVAEAEGLEAEVPDRRPLERERDRRALLDLERNRLAADRQRRSLVLAVELEPAAYPPARDLRAGILDAQERGGRDAQPRRDVFARGAGRAHALAERRGERRADPGTAMAVVETAQAEGVHRDEALEAEAGPDELVGLELDFEDPVGQRVAPARELDVRAPAAREPEREPAVVDLPRHREARVEAVLPRAPLVEEEGVGVEGGRERVARVPLLLGAAQRELGQRVEAVLVAARPEPLVQGAERCVRLAAEALDQVQLREDLAGRGARAIAGEYALAEIALHLARVGGADAHRRRAGGGEQRDERESGRQRRDPLRGPHRVLAGSVPPGRRILAWLLRRGIRPQIVGARPPRGRRLLGRGRIGVALVGVVAVDRPDAVLAGEEARLGRELAPVVADLAAAVALRRAAHAAGEEQREGDRENQHAHQNRTREPRVPRKMSSKSGPVARSRAYQRNCE